MVNSGVRIELRNILQRAVRKLSTEYAGSSLTDIFILIDQESGEIAIYDDEENCIQKSVVADWVDLPPVESENLSNSEYTKDLKAVIEQMHKEKLFDVLDIYTPFSISLTDESFIVQEELLLIDDDSVVRIESEFMERLDKEFDEFLEKLMKE